MTIEQLPLTQGHVVDAIYVFLAIFVIEMYSFSLYYLQRFVFGVMEAQRGTTGERETRNTV